MPSTREVAAKKAERQRRAQAALDVPTQDAETTAPSSKDVPPEWAEHDLVYFEDGPRAGSWMLLSHGSSAWTVQRRLARVNGETELTGRTLGYVPTNERQPHRLWKQVSARVLIWAPALAAQAEAKRQATITESRRSAS